MIASLQRVRSHLGRSMPSRFIESPAVFSLIIRQCVIFLLCFLRMSLSKTSASAISRSPSYVFPISDLFCSIAFPRLLSLSKRFFKFSSHIQYSLSHILRRYLFMLFVCCAKGGVILLWEATGRIVSNSCDITYQKRKGWAGFLTHVGVN